MTGALGTQDEWDRSYERYPLDAAGPDDPLRQWLEARFRGGRGTCLELGCFPGRFLAVLGELGYEVHGIDRTPRTAAELAPWLAGRGHRVGEFVQADFFTHQFARQYDVVCSFGVIEHFVDWASFLDRQAALVAPGGRLVVTAPNFRGWLQRGIHRWLDQANYARHCVDAMRPAAWAAHLAARGWEVIEHGGLGQFEYWVDPAERGPWQRAGLRLVDKLQGPLRRFAPAGSLWCCPYLRLLARRPEATS